MYLIKTLEMLRCVCSEGSEMGKSVEKSGCGCVDVERLDKRARGRRGGDGNTDIGRLYDGGPDALVLRAQDEDNL